MLFIITIIAGCIIGALLLRWRKPEKRNMEKHIWKAKDFITNGVNCPIADIREQITTIRAAVNADWVLMLVYQKEPKSLTAELKGLSRQPWSISTKERFFQSLAVLSFRNSALQTAADTATVDNRQLEAQLPEPPEYPSLTFISIEMLTSVLAGLPLPSSWIELVTRGSIADVNVMWIQDPQPARPSPSSGLPVRICLLGSNLNCNALRDKHQPLLDDLLSMINSSVPISVHRNLGRNKTAELVMSHYENQFQLERLINDSTSSAQYRTFVEQFGNSVLQAALALTGSSIGNLYLSTSNQRQLELVSQINNDCAIRTLALDEKQSVVSFVFRTNKPLLINDLADFRKTHPNITYRWVGSPTDERHPYAELAVPIKKPDPGSSKPIVLGVLNVEKAYPDDEGYYSDHDLSILLMLALRFCLWREGLTAAMVNRSFARVTPPNHHEGQELPEVFHSAKHVYIPHDFQVVRPHLSDTLQQAYDLTRSKTATLRLLSTDAGHLVRFCTSPDSGTEVRSADHYAISVDNPDSVNARVARTGKAEYLKDLYDHSVQQRVLKVRGKVRSEYCLPVFVHERLVGTLNFESEYPDAYSAEKYFLRAVLEQVQLALSFAQQFHEQTVLSVSARLTLNSHELLKCADDVGKLAEHASTDVATELLRLKGRLRRYAEITPRTDSANSSTDRHPDHKTYGSVLRDIVAAKNIGHLVTWDLPIDGDFSDVLAAHQLQPISLVMNEILDNSFLQATMVRGGQIRIDLAQLRRGGIDYRTITVIHNIAWPIAPELLRQVYRVPIKKTDRLHIGAFLAGAIMRSIGGDVQIAMTPNKRHSITVVEIPTAAAH
jgi:GAF domain-containing protein